MPELELSADQVRADGEAFLIAMPARFAPQHGREGHCCFAGCTVLPCGCCASALNPGHGLEPVPPSVLVALNQPCPTCSTAPIGCAVVPGRIHTFNVFGHATKPCPDCGGSGRLVFDLRTPCKVGCSPADHLFQGGVKCSVCGGSSIVSRRVWLDPEWGILPITYEGEGDEWNTEGCGSPHVMIFTGMSAGVPTRHLIICDGSDDPDTVVTDDVGEAPPAARPGDYVARTVRVAE